MRLRLSLWALLGAAAVAAVSLKPARGQFNANPMLLRPAFAKTILRPYLPLVVDLYYLRALNLIGYEDSAEKNRALYGYGSLLTSVDPRFYQAYLYLGLNIPFQESRGVYVNGELAAKLLRAGADRFPDDIRIHTVLGFTLFAIERDYVGAAEIFLRAARLPGAPAHFAPLAGRLLAQAGKPDDGISIMESLLERGVDDDVRPEIEQRLRELKVERDLQAVDDAAARFKAQTGQSPTTVQQLIDAGLFAGGALDAAGGTISIGADGRAMSTTLERRLELYE